MFYERYYWNKEKYLKNFSGTFNCLGLQNSKTFYFLAQHWICSQELPSPNSGKLFEPYSK